MKFICQINPLEAWKEASTHLMANKREEEALLVEINVPYCFESEWLTQYNPKAINSNFSALTDVIKTIFPYTLLRKVSNRHELYEYYLKLHTSKKRLGASKKGRWGTYFQRLIAFTSPHGEPINQLENVINKLNTWQTSQKAALKMHVSSPNDPLVKLGGPCLQYIQLKAGDKLCMTAVYRNQDFTNKALGNYIGLGLLLEFIAKEANMQAGTLTCFSIHAYLQASNKDTKKLIGDE